MSSFCDYNDVYSLVRGDITVIASSATQVAFKNCAPFTKHITKIDGTTINDAEDLDLVMLMYNLIEYTLNYSEKSQKVYDFIQKIRQLILITILQTLFNFNSSKFNAELLERVADLLVSNFELLVADRANWIL